MLSSDSVVMLSHLSLHEREMVGFDLASLGELAHHNVPILDAIVVTPQAFEEFQKKNNLTIQIKHLLGTVNPDRHDSLTQVESFLKKIIHHAEVPRGIFEKIFAFYEGNNLKKVSLEAYYCNDNKEISRKMWVGIEGEAVLIESVRASWAHLFALENIVRHNIHHNNHHAFSVVVVIRPSVVSDNMGVIVAVKGKGGQEFKIRSHSDEDALLSGKEMERLIEYARVAKRSFYHSLVIHWAKIGQNIVVTAVQPEKDEIEQKNEYSQFLGGIAVHPGITVGRLQIVGRDQKTVQVGTDEIIYLEKVDKEILKTLRKAKGIIVNEPLNPELHFMLKSLGIPSVSQAKKIENIYAHGDVITLNATTGEVKRGSILV